MGCTAFFLMSSNRRKTTESSPARRNNIVYNIKKFFNVPNFSSIIFGGLQDFIILLAMYMLSPSSGYR